MRIIASVSIAVLLATSCHVCGDVADFEDVIPLDIPATPFVSGGMQFVSNDLNNAVFPPGFAASDNGTQVFGWCGSACGLVQLITASLPDDMLFNVTSIDAGHLVPAGDPNGLGFVPGMTVELVGNLSGGGMVTQSLDILENEFVTFDLVGFNGLTSLEIFAPEVVKDAGFTGTPDPVIDNIVFNPVPEPGSASLVLLSALFVFRRTRRH